MPVDKLSGSLEENVLTGICWNPMLAPAVMMHLNPEEYSVFSYQKIAEKAYAYYDKFREPPRAHLADLLEVDMRRGEQGELIRRALQRMEKLGPQLNVEYVLAELNRFVRLRRLQNTLEKALDAIEDGDPEAVESVLYHRATDDSFTAGRWAHDPDAMLSFMERHERDHFTTGVEALDARNVRPARKELLCLIAPRKRGKSWFLVNVGKENIRYGHSVCHITLENSEEVTAMRYVQAFFGMEQYEPKQHRVQLFEKDDRGNFTSFKNEFVESLALTPDNRARVARKLRQLRRRPRLLIKEFPAKSLTITKLKAYLDWLERSEGFIPDLLILDYPKEMKVDLKNYRLSLGEIFSELRGIGQERNMAVVTVMQGNRGSSNAAIVEDDMISEDWSITGTVDVGLTYSRTPAEKSIGLARIKVSAARSAVDDFMVMVSQNYATGQFCIDSVHMTEALQRQAKIITGDSEENAA